MKKPSMTLAPWQVYRMFQALQELETHGEDLSQRMNPLSRAHGFYIKAFLKELETKAGL